MDRTWMNSRNWLRDPLVMALALSLSFHFLTYGVYRAGNAFGWWNVSVPFVTKILAKLNSSIIDAESIEEALMRQQEQMNQEVPLMFIDVTPDQATTEAPENAQFYGAVNSQAANVDPAEENADVPEIDGDQDKVPQTQDVAQNTVQEPITPTPPPDETSETPEEAFDPDQLQPAAEPETETRGQPEPTQMADEEVTTPGSPNKLEIPQPVTPKPGDLAFNEIRPQPEKGDGNPAEGLPEAEKPPRKRPRTLAQARQLQPQKSQIAGKTMKQEGGVKKRGIVPSVDTLGTPFGVYDAWLIAQVQQRWYYLLEQNSYAYNWAGHVKVKFRLYYDGRVTDFEIAENNSGELQGLICQKAIMENVPYRQWPPDLRRIVEKDYRELRFTFYYN